MCDSLSWASSGESTGSVSVKSALGIEPVKVMVRRVREKEEREGGRREGGKKEREECQ